MIFSTFSSQELFIKLATWKFDFENIGRGQGGEKNGT